MQEYDLHAMCMHVHYNNSIPYTNFSTVVNYLKPAVNFNMETGPWIAGGIVRELLTNRDWDQSDSDIDIFVKNDEQLLEVEQQLERLLEVEQLPINIPSHYLHSTLSKIHESENAITYEYKCGSTIITVQLITHTFENVEAIIDKFDFTISQFVTDGNVLCVGDTTLFDLGMKQIRINKITYPVSSLQRIIKYSKKGYKACNQTLSDFLILMANNEDMIIQTKFLYID